MQLTDKLDMVCFKCRLFSFSLRDGIHIFISRFNVSIIFALIFTVKCVIRYLCFIAAKYL